MFNTRRDMLKLLGVAPFLAPAFRDVFAAPNEPIKRAVMMMFHTGIASEYWFPQGANEGTMNLEGTSLESLTPVKNKVSIIQNLNNGLGVTFRGENHQEAPSNTFAAHRTSDGYHHQNLGVSLDQFIVNKMGFSTPRRNMTFALCNQGGNQPVFFKAAGSPADLIHNPFDAINDLFGTFVKGTPAVGGTKPVNNLAIRKSMLDVLSGDLARMSKRLAGPERQKLEAHLSLVRSSELRLGQGVLDIMQPPSMDTCSKYSGPAMQIDFRNTDNLPQLGEIFTDVIAMAMACDICRVFALEITQSNPDQAVNWPEVSVDGDAKPNDMATGLHFLAHSCKGEEKRTRYGKVNAVYAKIYASLLKKLDSHPDGNGTLLDNSVSILANGYGDSASHCGSEHSWENTPFIVGGFGGGFFKGGQIINAKGASHTQVLGSVLESFGIDRSPAANAPGAGAFGLFEDAHKDYIKYESLPGLKA